MEFRAIRYALSVAKERSFTKAASRLNISQSAVSDQVRLLEDEVGFPLFRRTGRGIELTERGRTFLYEAERVVAVMPASQGVLPWPPEGPGLTLLADETDLPLPDRSMDRIVLVHALEATEQVRGMMREMWRVLADGGRLVVVVPNRRGVWARFDTSPFGHGQPFSKPQLSSLLKESQFSVVSWSYALYFPPTTSGAILSAAPAIEGLGSRLMPALSGAIIVEAAKQVYAVAQGKRLRRFAARTRPVLAPIPAKGSWRHP